MFKDLSTLNYTMKVTSYDNILILRFNGNKKNMNEVLDPISNVYEGVIYNREGHNFPSNMIDGTDHYSSTTHQKTLRRCKLHSG